MRVSLWVLLLLGCGRNTSLGPPITFDASADTRLDNVLDVAMDRASDQRLDSISDSPSPDVSFDVRNDNVLDAQSDVLTDVQTDTGRDPGPCLMLPTSGTLVLNADNTDGFPYDRGMAAPQTSECPLIVSANGPTEDSPSSQFYFCNSEAMSANYSIAVDTTTVLFDPWVAVYEGSQVPADPRDCTYMNDDAPGTTDSLIPSVTVGPSGDILVVVVGQNRSQYGPLTLTVTRL